MKRKSGEDDSRPYIKPVNHLSPKEALRLVQLEHVVEESRSQVLDYLLLRASFSANMVEKKAWYILVCLLSYVERNHRFPNVKEQISFLKIALSGQMPKLPQLQKVDLVSNKEQIGIVREMQRRNRDEREATKQST